MSRARRHRARLKWRLTLAYAVAPVLTPGVFVVMVYAASRRLAWSLTWFGCWGFAVHQAVMLVVRARCGANTSRV